MRKQRPLQQRSITAGGAIRKQVPMPVTAMPLSPVAQTNQVKSQIRARTATGIRRPSSDSDPRAFGRQGTRDVGFRHHRLPSLHGELDEHIGHRWGWSSRPHHTHAVDTLDQYHNAGQSVGSASWPWGRRERVGSSGVRHSRSVTSSNDVGCVRVEYTNRSRGLFLGRRILSGDLSVITGSRRTICERAVSRGGRGMALEMGGVGARLP